MTAPSRLPDAALGVRSHSGWAAYVVLAGDPKAPDILARGRMQLCDPRLEGAKQPFHHAEPMPFTRGAAFVERCRQSTLTLARDAVGRLLDTAAIRGCCLLTSSERALPGLKAILASHALIHTAEGAFYRDALEAACDARNIPVRRVREREIETACQCLPASPAEVNDRLAGFGRSLGAPWTQDEKLSARGAWLMLAALPARRARR